MPVMLDDMKAEFVRVMSQQPLTKISMDKALAHVIALAYAAGIDDGQRRIILNQMYSTEKHEHK